jgi:hypothetical protein
VRTPVEELGLSCARLAQRVGRAVRAVPAGELAALDARLEELAVARRLVYFRDDDVAPIRILHRPLVALHEQLSYARFVSGTVQGALKRLPDLYLADPAVRAIVRLTPDEERWLADCWTPRHRDTNPVFGRLDAVIDFAGPGWRDGLRFLEANLSGIGGLHLVPTCDRIVVDEILPRLRAHDPSLHLEASVDLRELLMQEIADHLEAIGRRGEHVVFVEPKYAGWGPDEQEEIARYLRSRYGLRVLHADPSELRVRGDEVMYEDTVVDVAYRDYAILDLVDLEAEGVDIEPMRRLLREDRMISSLAGDFDGKAGFELLTDPALAARHFRPQELSLFRRHLPWTRVIGDRRTTLPDGREGDLLELARRARETLVLKPDRGYGGEGVLVGAAVGQGEWERGLAAALADRDDTWVLQARVPLPTLEVGDETFHVVLGFVPSRYGVGVLARASQGQVVNVAQRGGMCAVVVGATPPPGVGDPPLL